MLSALEFCGSKSDITSSFILEKISFLPTYNRHSVSIAIPILLCKVSKTKNKIACPSFQVRANVSTKKVDALQT